MGQKFEEGQGAQLSLVKGERDALEQLLVVDVFRPNGESNQLDELAQRLRPRGNLRCVRGKGRGKGKGVP